MIHPDQQNSQKSEISNNSKHIKEYEIETPNRRFFFFEKNKKRTAQVHLVKKNSRWFKRHIAFRNELRSNEIIRKKYQSFY